MGNRIKQGISPRMAEIGKIKIGEHSDRKTKVGTYLPTRLDHFKVVTTEKDKKKQNFLEDEQVMAVLGPEPQEVQVILPFDDPEMIFQTSYAFYKGRKCLCRGDGETAVMEFQKDGKPGKFSLLDEEELGETVTAGESRKIVCDSVNCPMRQPDQYGSTACKANGRLCVIIPASKRLNGYYFFRTTSINTIAFITAALDQMKEQSGGILKGIPAKLFFFRKNTEKHGNVPVVTLDWDFSDIEKFRASVISENKHRLEFKVNIKQLEDKAKSSGILEDNDDPADIEAEYYRSGPTAAEKVQEKKIATSAESRADSVLDSVESVEDAEIEEVEETAEEETPEAEETAPEEDKKEPEAGPSLF